MNAQGSARQLLSYWKKMHIDKFTVLELGIDPEESVASITVLVEKERRWNSSRVAIDAAS